MNILHPKEVCRVGCWNVRTLYQTRKLAQVLKEIILHRMIDPYLRKEKAGFRKGKLCADQFFSLRLEQRYDGTPHYMPISLTLSKHLIVYTVLHYGRSSYIMAYPTRSSPSYKCCTRTFTQRWSAAQNCHTASRFKQGCDKDACSHRYSLTFE